MITRSTPLTLTSLVLAMSTQVAAANPSSQYSPSDSQSTKAAPEEISMPAAPVLQPSVPSKRAAALLTSHGLKSLHATRVLTLPALQETELKTAKMPDQRQRLTEHDQPLQVGFARKIQQKNINLANLEWTRTQHGTWVSVFEIKSEFAAALRAALRFQSTAPRRNDLDHAFIRFTGNDGKVFEEQASNYLNEHWSPVISGDLLTVEMELPTSIDPHSLHLLISQVSHLKLSPNVDDQTLSKAYKDSEHCEKDVVCKLNPSKNYTNTAKAVARMLFTSDGNTYICTGTLLNNNNAPKRPLFWTAAHCIHTRKQAESLETYWFYQRTTCGGGDHSDLAISLAGGANLLYTNNLHDTSLLELKSSPPAGAYYAAWSNRPLTTLGTPVLGLHHPAGDVKKYSLGKIIATTASVNDRRPFYGVSWQQGVTEEGSSGSGLFTLSDTGEYQLRGGLYGGNSSCSAADAPDFYSRFSDVFDRIRPYLGK